jgi:putative addiction module killer protein
LSSIEYNARVFTIKRTEEFNAWLLGLKDGLTHRRLLVRLRKASLGNLGDVKPVGSGVYEMREDFGPGWRMYYVQRGTLLIVMLGGGAKRTQQADIATAKARAATIED